VALGGGSGGRGVLEESTHGEIGKHLALHAGEDLGEIELARVGLAGHDVEVRCAGEKGARRETLSRPEHGG
jgi:hypothetical protein